MDIWKFSKWSHCTNIYLKCMPFVHDMPLNIPIMYSLFMRRQNSQQCKFPHLVSRRDSYICRCIGLTYVDFIVCQRIFLTFVDDLFSRLSMVFNVCQQNIPRFNICQVFNVCQQNIPRFNICQVLTFVGSSTCRDVKRR